MSIVVVKAVANRQPSAWTHVILRDILLVLPVIEADQKTRTMPKMPQTLL
jgi:hypothetical protein